jgi:GR25 family glycosyltransferase involved in LPS biosynthesis
VRAVVIGDRREHETPPGIDVELVPPGVGRTAALGCYLAHRREWVRAAYDGVETLAVFEDDAVFVLDFNWRLRALLDTDDWDVLMLGGQHVEEPTPFDEDRVRCTWTIRTHAYVLRRLAILTLASAPPPGTRVFDYDMRDWLEELTVVAPKVWLAGQAAGYSSINKQHEPERWWEHGAASMTPARVL